MSKIILTKLDAEGNLVRTGSEELKVLKIIRLSENPFLFSDKVKLYTNNLDEKFVKKFISDNGLDFDELKKIRDWFPFYYVTYLMELAEAIKDFGIKYIKNEMLNYFQETNILSAPLKNLVNNISNDLNKNTKIGTISDEFSTFTNIDFIMFCVV